MHVIYKPCRKKDLISAFKVVRTSFNHLRVTTGKKPIYYRIKKHPEFEHLFKIDHKNFWCAWAGKNIIGFTAALIRDKQWYLAWLFVHPSYQDKGVGRELLNKVWINRPGMSHSLSTFSFNMQAVGIYSKYGMVPQCSFPIMEIDLKKSSRPKPSGLKIVDKPSRHDLAWIIKLDAQVRGYTHPQEWRFWSKFEDTHIYVFKDKGKRVGYSMVYNWGGISPAGAISNKYLVDVIADTIRVSKSKDSKMRICCPTHNMKLYQYLIGLGFRLREMDLFMSDKPYPDFQRYIPAQLAIF